MKAWPIYVNVLNNMTLENENYKYLFGSRILTHILFWCGYYVCFSFLWANEGELHQSFGLELILMPLRIGASYTTLYWLIPKYLLNDRAIKFALFYTILMIVAGSFQRILTFYFYEFVFDSGSSTLWSLSAIVRAMVLINSTVLFLSAIKMYDYWRIEKTKSKQNNEKYLEVRSEKRNYRVYPSEIQFIEGLGNYVTIYLDNKKPIISYLKLKELEQILPSQFYRVHKSFIINREKIQSYSTENIEIGERLIPIGKSIEIDNLK